MQKNITIFSQYSCFEWGEFEYNLILFCPNNRVIVELPLRITSYVTYILIMHYNKFVICAISVSPNAQPKSVRYFYT